MDIGMGLAALDSYFKAGDARKEREYLQAKRDAELSTLPEKTESERTGYRLRTGQNTAGLDTLPQETANKSTRLKIESTGLAGQQARQPVEEQTKDITASIGLSNAQNQQTNLPKTQAIQNNLLEGQFLTSQHDIKQLPQKLRMAAVQGKLDARGQSDVVLGTLGQLIASQDKAGAIDFANQIAQETDILPNTNGKTFSDITPVRGGPEGDGYQFTTTDGTTRFVPVQAFQSAIGKLKTGEYQFIHDSYGNVYSGNKKTGAVTQTHQGDPKARHAQHTPAEVQTMEWLMSKGVAKNPSEAWEHVRSAREKTRSSFVLDYVAKNGGLGKDPKVVADEAGKVYDDLRQMQGSPAPKSNSPTPGTLGTGTVDPRINSLIGVPSQ